MAWTGKAQRQGLEKRREIQAKHDWEVRKRIELYRDQGMGQRRIAKALTENGVETPRLFSWRMMEKRGVKPQNEWTPSAVARIMKRLGMVATSPECKPSSQRWNIAVQALIDLQAQYRHQLDRGPDGRHSTRVAQELEDICSHDLDKLRVEWAFSQVKGWQR